MKDDLLSHLSSKEDKDHLARISSAVDTDKRIFNSHTRTWLIKCGGQRTFFSCHLNVTETELNI